MQKFYFLVALFLSASSLLVAQNGLIGQGFSTGFNNPADITSFSPSFGSTRILTRQSSATGNQFFRLVRADNFDNTEYGPAATCPGSDQFITNTTGTVFNGVGGCGKAFAINVPNTSDFYIFKTPNAGSSTEFMFFRIEGPIASVVVTEQLPSPDANGDVPPNTDVMVSSQTDSPLPSGQTAYLRYSTNNFATSTVLPMSVTSGATSSTATATIPGQPDGTTVAYYIFTSGDNVAPLANGDDADYRTINADNKGGTNYNYTTSIALPVTYLSWAGSRRKANLVDLRWATATEDQAGHFAVECSADRGQSWTPRANVAARNSPTGAAYTFTDQNTPAGQLQYRLRQTDLDGTEHFSAIIEISAWEEDVRIWPQPASTGILHLTAPEAYAGGTAELLSIDGKKLSSTPLTAGNQTIDLNSAAKGMYVLRLIDRDGQPVLRKVVVE